MKLSGKIISKSSLLVTLCTLLPLLTSCTKDCLYTTPVETESVMLQINLDTNPMTKSTVAPTDNESMLKSVRIYAFVGNELIGHYFNNGNPAESSFWMHLDVVTSYNNQSDIPVDFIVIANGEALGGIKSDITIDQTTTRAALESLQFSSIAGTHLGTNDSFLTSGMPNVTSCRYWIDMTEHTPNGAAGHENHSKITKIYAANSDGTINKDSVLDKVAFSLQRPVGKLAVFAAMAPGTPEGNTLTVSGIRLLNNGRMTYNYLLSQPTSTLKEMREYEGSDLPLCISKEVAANSTDGGSKAIDKTLTTAGSTTEGDYTSVLFHPVYLHENPYGASPSTWSDWKYYEPGVDQDGTKTWTEASDQPTGKEQFKGNILEIDYYFGNDASEVKTGTVYLPPIERNHYYGVYCSMNNTGRLVITYVVQPWEKAEDSWGEIDFDIPEYSSLTPYPGVDYNPICWFDQTGAEGMFMAQFKIKGPAGQPWKPTLLGALEGDYQITVARKDSDNIAVQPDLYNGDYYADETSQGNPFIIIIRPLKAVSAEKTVDLVISYTPMWDPTGQDILIINGTPGDATKPWGGNDEEKITITQKVQKPTTT